jgi:hypothetical protein
VVENKKITKFIEKQVDKFRKKLYDRLNGIKGNVKEELFCWK